MKIINVPYRDLIGGLMYLSTTAERWKTGKKVLRYVGGAKDIGLTYN